MRDDGKRALGYSCGSHCAQSFVKNEQILFWWLMGSHNTLKMRYCAYFKIVKNFNEKNGGLLFEWATKWSRTSLNILRAGKIASTLPGWKTFFFIIFKRSKNVLFLPYYNYWFNST